MKQKIVGYHIDADSHWVAELECGHGQHVRDDPPWRERPWVRADGGRASQLGQELNCVRCDEFARKVAEAGISIRSAGTDCSFGLPKGRPGQANGGARQSEKDPGRDHSVMGGAIISESGAASSRYRGAALSRNWGAASSGISTLRRRHRASVRRSVSFRSLRPRLRCCRSSHPSACGRMFEPFYDRPPPPSQRMPRCSKSKPTTRFPHSR
jgi:hypothetical protein